MRTQRLFAALVVVSSAAGGLPAAEPAADLPIQRVVAPVGEAKEHVTLLPPRSVYDQAFDAAFKKATQGWMEDPLRFIHADMAQSAGALAAFHTDKPVQKVQDQAVARLDAVIKLLDQQCKSGAGGGNPNPTKPLARSVIAGGPGGQGDMHDPKAGEKQWASLPAKQREQILQSKTQGFPPGFESILQSYYERLAQEPVGDAGATGTAASQGAK